MNPPKIVFVDAEDLRTSFEFVSSGVPFENNAHICLDTGKIYWKSDDLLGEEEDLPEDLETSDRYITMPHENDLGLGRHLALAFVEQELPDDVDTVEGFFGRRGAYGRFNDLLAACGMLQRWYELEACATEAALLAWCEENGIQPVHE